MQKHYMRKYELTTVLLVCTVVLISSIVATVYGVYPFEEFQLVDNHLTLSYPGNVN